LRKRENKIGDVRENQTTAQAVLIRQSARWETPMWSGRRVLGYFIWTLRVSEEIDTWVGRCVRGIKPWKAGGGPWRRK
jgi:hypothetical protein